jgi:hypothetical protein
MDYSIENDNAEPECFCKTSWINILKSVSKQFYLQYWKMSSRERSEIFFLVADWHLSIAATDICIKNLIISCNFLFLSFFIYPFLSSFLHWFRVALNVFQNEITTISLQIGLDETLWNSSISYLNEYSGQP